MRLILISGKLASLLALLAATGLLSTSPAKAHQGLTYLECGDALRSEVMLVDRYAAVRSRFVSSFPSDVLGKQLPNWTAEDFEQAARFAASCPGQEPLSDFFRTKLPAMVAQARAELAAGQTKLQQQSSGLKFTQAAETALKRTSPDGSLRNCFRGVFIESKLGRMRIDHVGSAPFATQSNRAGQIRNNLAFVARGKASKSDEREVDFQLTCRVLPGLGWAVHSSGPVAR
jgi:hypothetical protein